MLCLIVLVAVFVYSVESFSAAALLPPTRRYTNKRKGTLLLSAGSMSDDEERTKAPTHSRRSLLNTLGTQSVAAAMLSQTCFASPAIAAASSRSAEAQVTDKIYVDVKGLSQDEPPQRIVIGLFGKDAPQAVDMLKALVSPTGLKAPCKPRESRSLQKEQLEANKVYNSCVEGQDKGVNYDYATIWRVVKDERIDVGAVSGKFIAREFPNFEGTNDLKNDVPGVVSVRRGNNSGFGFTIYPGNGDSKYLDANHIVVGRVIEGMDVVNRLNDVGVVTSAKLPSFTELSPAPSRACRYGGKQLYCNEYKPLQKLSLSSTGVL
jgi:cyclophilin family peptidyl-prolyl cis-trans isomerase